MWWERDRYSERDRSDKIKERNQMKTESIEIRQKKEIKPELD